jgi:hypothetical protein
MLIIHSNKTLKKIVQSLLDTICLESGEPLPPGPCFEMCVQVIEPGFVSCKQRARSAKKK